MLFKSDGREGGGGRDNFVDKGTVEEQIYLTNIKREKDAFEYLIKEKAVIDF